jgi:hypothetical protein
MHVPTFSVPNQNLSFIDDTFCPNSANQVPDSLDPANDYLIAKTFCANLCLSDPLCLSFFFWIYDSQFNYGFCVTNEAALNAQYITCNDGTLETCFTIYSTGYNFVV